MQTTNENTTINIVNASSSKFNWEKAKKQIINLEDTLKRSLRSQSGKYAIFRFFSYDCMRECGGYYVNDIYIRHHIRSFFLSKLCSFQILSFKQ